jgi:Holliday junction resolvase RusA-like endonuclease
LSDPGAGRSMMQPLFEEPHADANTLLLAFTVYGDPAPQGSKKARPVYRGRGKDRVFTGRVAQQESSKAVKPWRDAVRAASLIASGGRHLHYRRPVIAEMVFTVSRPARRPEWWPPEWPWGKDAQVVPACFPDLDKYLRATSDALSPVHTVVDRFDPAKRKVVKMRVQVEGGALADDALIVGYRNPRKVYPGVDPDALDRPGAVIRIFAWTPWNQ